jgi:hypothetical protein
MEEVHNAAKDAAAVGALNTAGFHYSARKEGKCSSMATRITMFLGSMDHSPSEQLGEPDDWHTSVLILSEAGEHFGLAKNLALRLKLSDGMLRKWSRNPPYRRKGEFGAALFDVLPQNGVFVKAVSAQSRTIRDSYAHMIAQLQLARLIEAFSKNEKPYLRFGPFTRLSPGEEPQPAYFEILERQAISLIFICHFVLRTHQQLMPIIKEQRPEIEWVDWQLMPNKFPGDIRGPMGSLFHAIMSGVTHLKLASGHIRIATFDYAKDDDGSLTADNIAGWLSELISSGQQQLASPLAGKPYGWDIWGV